MTTKVYTHKEQLVNRKKQYECKHKMPCTSRNATIDDLLGVVAIPTCKDTTTLCPHRPKTKDALEWVLDQMGVDVRHNVRSHQTQFRLDGNEEWEALTGRAASFYRSEIESCFAVETYKGIQPLTFGRDGFIDALDAMLHHKEADPLTEYLAALPPAAAGRRKLAGALAHCFTIADGYKELAAWASQMIFLGVVWRTFNPGHVLDEMPILVGAGGIGKTTYLRLAVPQNIVGLYGSGMDFAASPQQRVEALQGKAIVECSEMVGATVADTGRIKDFISRTDDGSIRLSYRHDPEPLPRRCVMVGTADRAKFLAPDSNPRRFVPIILEHGKATKVRKYMATERDNLWAEALDLYQQGVEPRLPDKLKRAAHAAAVSAFVV